MVLRTLSRWYGNLFNDRVGRRLQSDKHGLLSKNHLLISFAGRKTGKQYTIPVNYQRDADGRYFIGTEAPWWRNLQGGVPVEILVAGETLKGNAAAVLDDEEKRARALRMLTPGFGWLMKSVVIIEIATD